MWRERLSTPNMMSIEEARSAVAAHPWWYHKFEIFPGLITPGVYDPSGTLERLKLGKDMTGSTVLEIGPADGYFTKTLTDRGARVTAIDYVAKDHYGFATMEKLDGRSFEFIHANIYDIGKLNLGFFDVVICLGVLYHLPDMLRALWAIRPHIKARFILETFVSRKHEDEPLAEYLPGASCNEDPTNFWAPNLLCCKSMLQDTGYTVEDVIVNENRATFHARPSETGLATKVHFAYSAHSRGASPLV
jgi:tRNA (mo5U34)-methyltransferase